MEATKTYEELESEIQELKYSLEQAMDTIEAIQTGQIDALVVKEKDGHRLYTLKTADQTYRVFIEKMNEGALTINKDGIILYSNARLASMLNLPLGKVIGTKFTEFVPTEKRSELELLIRAGWETGYQRAKSIC